MLAMADPKSADDWYKEGETQYNLGDFEKAASAFKQGYTLESVDSKKPAYLYNVAQAYRQGKKCKDAAFFYKRYLSLKEQDAVKPLKPEKKTEIEGWIAELEECEKTQTSIAAKPPDTTMHPDGGSATRVGMGSAKGSGSATATGSGSATGSGKQVALGSDEGSDGSDEGSDTDGGVHATTTTAPKLLSARFTGGAAKISAGDLTVPVQATFSLFAGYPLMLDDKLEIDVGVAATFTPIPFTNIMDPAKKGTAQFITALADVGATYTVAPKIGVRVDAGIGALIFSGMGEAGNPFTTGGASTTGALTMLAVRAGVSADYAITPNVIATIAPIAFTYSPPKAGLREEIKSITRIDFMLGIGYRM
jgi:tetratricopeptide (TPR) repeat protein